MTEHSFDEVAKVALLPIGEFVPDHRGLMSWTPRFDRILVTAPPVGGVCLHIDRHGEPSVLIDLTPVAARWLGDKLRSASFAAEGMVDSTGVEVGDRCHDTS